MEIKGMGKRRRRKVVKAKGLSKRWAADNVQIKSSTRRKSDVDTWLKDVDVHPTRHVASMGKPRLKLSGDKKPVGGHKIETVPATKFSLQNFALNGLPLAEVLRKLQTLRVQNPDASGVKHVSNTDNWAKVYGVPSIIDNQSPLSKVNTFHYVLFEKTKRSETRLYFYASDYYFIEFASLTGFTLISRSKLYSSREHARTVFDLKCIMWVEELRIYDTEES